jgi:DNA polymerase-1
MESTSFGPASFWGPGPYDDGYRLRLVQIGTRDEAWLLDPQAPATKVLLADESITFVSQTDVDPIAMETQLGVSILDRWLDTYTLSALSGRRAGSRGLKPTADDYGMPELAAADAELDGIFGEMCREAGEPSTAANRAAYGYTNIAVDHPVFLRYSGLDAIACLRLVPLLLADAQAPREAIQSAMEIARENARLKMRGVRADLKLLAELEAKYPPLHAAAVAAFEEHTGGVNPKSPKQITEYFEAAGVDFATWAENGGSMTGTDAPSLGKDSWKTLFQYDLDDHHVRAVELYGELKQSQNAAATIGQLAAAVGTDGRIHPNIVPEGTDTGRMSSRAPNMQNLKGEMRHIVIADPGFVLASIDFDGLEAKMAAAFSQDPALIAATAPGADFHQATADLIGIDRKPAKTLNFQILFGGGARAVAAALRIALAEARTLIGQWWSAYPELSRLNDGLKQRTDYVPLLNGRRIRVPRFVKGDQKGEHRTYANLNYLIQGSSAQALKAAILRVSQVYGLGHLVMLYIHDELLVQVPEDQMHLLDSIVEAMNFSLLGIQFTAGAAVLRDEEGVSRWVES